MLIGTAESRIESDARPPQGPSSIPPNPNPLRRSRPHLLDRLPHPRPLHDAGAYSIRFRTADDHFEFGWEMGRIARALASGYGFANPFNGHSGPTAWTPPLYPLIIAPPRSSSSAASTRLKAAWAILTAQQHPLPRPPRAGRICQIAWRCFGRPPSADRRVQLAIRRESRRPQHRALVRLGLGPLSAAMQYAVPLGLGHVALVASSLRVGVGPNSAPPAASARSTTEPGGPSFAPSAKRWVALGSLRLPLGTHRPLQQFAAHLPAAPAASGSSGPALT